MAFSLSFTHTHRGKKLTQKNNARQEARAEICTHSQARHSTPPVGVKGNSALCKSNSLLLFSLVVVSSSLPAHSSSSPALPSRHSTSPHLSHTSPAAQRLSALAAPYPRQIGCHIYFRVFFFSPGTLRPIRCTFRTRCLFLLWLFQVISSRLKRHFLFECRSFLSQTLTACHYIFEDPF